MEHIINNKEGFACLIRKNGRKLNSIVFFYQKVKKIRKMPKKKHIR